MLFNKHKHTQSGIYENADSMVSFKRKIKRYKIWFAISIAFAVADILSSISILVNDSGVGFPVYIVLIITFCILILTGYKKGWLTPGGLAAVFLGTNFLYFSQWCTISLSLIKTQLLKALMQPHQGLNY